MTDPLSKGTATAPPIIGSGCTQRYDPDHLGPDVGTDFPGADALWKLYRPSVDETAPKPVTETSADT